MKKVHLADLGKLYQDIVHNTLFFEVLHHLAHGFAIVLAAVSDLMEEHGPAVALVLAIAVSLLLRLRPSRPPVVPVRIKPSRQRRRKRREPPEPSLKGKKGRKQGRVAQKRDNKGRFV